MELLIRRFADPRARGVGFGDEPRRTVRRDSRRRIERDRLERALDVRQLRLQRRPAARGTGPAPRTAGRRRRRCRAADGSRRSPPACAGRCDRAGRCAAPPPTASTAGRTARAGGRTRSCGPRRPLRWTRAGSVRRARGTAPPRCRAAPPTALRGRRRWRAARARLSAVRSISSVSRWATNTSVFSSRRRQRGACGSQPGEARIACVHRVRLLAQLASRRARARPAAPHPTPARGGCDRLLPRATAIGVAAPAARAHGPAIARPSPQRAAPPPGGDRSRTATRGGRPPMSTRRVELVHGGSGMPRRKPRLDVDVLRELVRPQQLQQPEEAVRVVLERRRAEQQHVAAERGDRRDGALCRLAGMSAAGAAAAAPRRRPSRSMPAATAWSVSSGRSTSVSSAMTARRWTSNGLKPAPKSRATSARRGASSSVNTWWYLRHSSPSHCTVSASGATTRQRSICRVCSRRFMISAASMVLPRPDLVGEQPAHRDRGRSRARRRAAGAGTAGRVRRGTSPRPPASRVASRCRMSSRVRKSSVSSISPGGQPLEQRPVAPSRLVRLGHERIAGRGQPERGPTAGKVDDQAPAFDRGDATGAELGIEAVGQVVPDGPGMHPVILPGLANRLLGPERLDRVDAVTRRAGT